MAATITPNKNLRTILAAGTSNAAGATATGATVDLRTTAGPHLLTARVANGATAPTGAAQIQVNVSGDGATWRPFQAAYPGPTANSGVSDWTVEIPAGTMYLQVVVSGNTAQAVTCEAFLHELSSYASAP